MVIETATVWSLSALLFVMIVIAFYFTIFFMIWYAIGWGLSKFFKAVIKMMYG